MKLTASISYSDSVKSCQVSAELELENSVTAATLSTQTCELLKGLQSGIADAVSSNPMINTTPPVNPTGSPLMLPVRNQTELPVGAVAPDKRKQRPEDQPSPKQKKFLNDLLRANGLNLSRWCKDKNVRESQITAEHCRQWIPELQDMSKGTRFPF